MSAGSSSVRTGRARRRSCPIVGLELWPTAGTVEVLGARYGQVDSRELRERIGTAGSAVEGSLRPDLTPVTLVMTARHAATEPWWHVYRDADRTRARGLLDGLGLGARRRPRLRDVVGGRAAADLDRPGADAGPRPAPARRAGGQPRSRGARDAHRRPHRAGRRAARRPPSCSSRITSRRSRPGSRTGWSWPAGSLVAAGPLDDVLRDDVLSRAFGLPITVEWRDGRAWARDGARTSATNR